MPERGARQRVARVTALLCVALSACGAAGGAASDTASCAVGVSFRGELYEPVGPLEPSAPGQPLGEVALLCGEEDAEITVSAVEGVAPRFAIAATLEGKPRLLLGRGYPAELRSHPLHQRFFQPASASSRPDCARRLGATGALVEPPPLKGELYLPQKDASGLLFRLHARSVIIRSASRVQPPLRSGDVVSVTGRACKGRSPAMADTVRLIRRGRTNRGAKEWAE